MAIPEAEPPFCRLYIDTTEAREAVQRLLDRLLRPGPAGPRVLVSVSRNDGYEPGRARDAAYDPIAASAWTAELDTELPPSGDHEAFRAWVVAVIGQVRAGGMIVTASCDFEDRVAAETGWNWSTSTPEPPR